MTDLEVKNNWNEIKQNLKHRLTVIINNDTLLEEGKRDELSGHIKIGFGKTKEWLLKYISEL